MPTEYERDKRYIDTTLNDLQDRYGKIESKVEILEENLKELVEAIGQGKGSASTWEKIFLMGPAIVTLLMQIIILLRK